jgi:hypothetical protein
MIEKYHIPQSETPVDVGPERSTRRAFLAGVGRKAVYVTPIVLTLSANSAFASPHSASCKQLGGSCTTNNDCCSNNCTESVCL